MGAHHLGSAGVFAPVGGGGPADGRQLVLGEGHAGGTEVGNPLGQLKISDFLQAIRGGVGKILPHAAVEVDVHQPGDDIAPGGVQDGIVPAGLRDQETVGADVPLDKALFQVEDLTTGDPHLTTPAAISLLRAASSPTRTTSGWSWRIEPGHLGVMGPQTEL